MEEIIKKFWQKKITEQELKELLQQLGKEDPELYEQLKKQFELRLYNTNRQESVREEKFEKILKQLHDKIRTSQTGKTKWLLTDQFYKVAAVVAFIFLAAGIWYLSTPGQLNPLELNKADFTRIENTHDDKVMNLKLKDGSQIKLYPNSSIDYPASYGIENRNLSLEGKAYFKVARNKDLPFVVIADNYTTTALGTEFLVYSQAEKLQVKLYEGSVVVKSTAKSKFKFESVYLKPGEEFNINTKTGFYNHSTINHKEFKSGSGQVEFTENKNATSGKIQVLKYKKESLKMVLDELSKHYGKPIKYQSSEIGGLTFTGDIYLDEKLTNSIRTLCQLNGLNYTENKDEIIIHK